jgi:[ribosomal protein S5]-alanine N-acetyltransferase
MLKSYFHQSSERLEYRAITKADVEDWKEFFVDNDRLHFVGMKDKGTIPEMSEYWITKQLDRYKKGNYGMLAVMLKGTETVVGQVGLLPRDDIKGVNEVEIGYSLKPKYWGKGYGTEMAKQMHKFGKENNIAPRFISMIDKENDDSVNVAKKNGMKFLFEYRYYEMDMFIYGTEPEN